MQNQTMVYNKLQNKKAELPFSVKVSPQETGAMIIDLAGVQKNYQTFEKHIAPTTIAPVVKANAYGLGMIPVCEALANVGAKEFFVATIDEGIALKKAMPGVVVYVLYGIFADTIDVFFEHDLVPVLNTVEQIDCWNKFAGEKQMKLPAVIHFDTGMSRTGLTAKEVEWLMDNQHILSSLDLHYVMSHLACSEVPDHPMNTKQKDAFQRFAEAFPGVKRSLAASTLMKTDSSANHDMARLGYGLYGFCYDTPAIQLTNCLHVYSRIVQLRDSVPGDTVGYGANYVVEKAGRLATLSIGYADGYHRFLHNYKTYVYIGPYKAYLAGRISMDFCVVDVSHIPEDYLYEGAWVEMIGEHIRVADLVTGTDFVPHEVPISLGNRYIRHYLPG
ncbi:MAG: alanine racemase [Alphaproteobacteria bacterium]|nr:alanine racemase [Alphaproteobacteria bacterium]